MSKALGIMVGILLFSMIVVGSNYWLGGFKENYDGLQIESGWEEDFDFIDNMTSISEEMSNVLESEQTNWATGGFRLGYSVLKSFLKVPKYISDVFGRIAERLQIPTWAVTYVIVIMMMVIMLAIIAPAILRWWL